MLTLPPSVRIYVAAEPTDLRKSFDGLSALVAHSLGRDPLSGHLFVFRNRRGDQVRILLWDRNGYALYAKRLARGRFHFTWKPGAEAGDVEVEAAELSLMLEGIDLSGALRRPRWPTPTRPGAPARRHAAQGVAASRHVLIPSTA